MVDRRGVNGDVITLAKPITITGEASKQNTTHTEMNLDNPDARGRPGGGQTAHQRALAKAVCQKIMPVAGEREIRNHDGLTISFVEKPVSTRLLEIFRNG